MFAVAGEGRVPQRQPLCIDIKLLKCVKADYEPKPLVKISVQEPFTAGRSCFFERTASGLMFRLQIGPSLLLCVLNNFPVFHFIQS